MNRISFFIILFLSLGFYSCSNDTKKKLKTYIESDPSRARFYVEGKFVGYTPLFFSYQPDREIQFSLVKENYHLFSKKQTLLLHNQFTLVPKLLKVTINLSSSVKFFYLNGRRLSFKKQTLLRKGKHEVFFYKKGFYPIREKIQVLKKESNNFIFKFKKIESRFSFLIESPLSGVEVFENNFFLGELPFKDKIIKEKKYFYRFKKKGYVEKKLDFSFRGNRAEKIILDLTPLKKNYSLTLESLPPDTTVTIFKKQDKKQEVIFKNQTKTLKLTPGAYRLLIRNLDYYSFFKEFSLTNNLLMKVKLKKKSALELPLLAKIDLKEKIKIFSGIEFYNQLFFLNDFRVREKYIFDKNFNFLEKVTFPKKEHGLIPILDPNIFRQGVFSFGNQLFWRGMIYQYFVEENLKFKKITYSKIKGKYLALIDKGWAAIFLFREESGDGEKKWRLVDKIDFKVLLKSQTGFLSKLDLVQVDFLDEKQIIFFDKLSNKILRYNFEKKEFFPFIKKVNYKPLKVEGLFVNDYIVLIKVENNRVLVFDKEGSYQTFFKIKEVVGEVEYLLVENNVLYVFSLGEVYLYKL